MVQSEYRPRLADDWLRARLRSTGAVVIEGAKACGKTETARRAASSEVLLDLDEPARAQAQINPARLLEGPTPRLIDEWQVEPGIWNHVRRAVDDSREKGLFILTGSSVPAEDQTRHSGAGRFARVRMRPMSSYESGHSDGAVSLAGLMQGEEADSGLAPLSLDDVAASIARGGWPELQDIDTNAAMLEVQSYLDEVCRVDIQRADGVARDPERVRRLLQSVARNVATEVSASTLAADVGGSDQTMKAQTVGEYLRALERIFVVEHQPAWAPHLRSRYVLRRSAKRHFVDPSIAVAALRATPGALMDDLNLMGFMFESMVVRDLRIYSQGAGAVVRHYRDSDGIEVDAIVDLGYKQWAAFEIKLGGEKGIEAAAASLQKFARRIDSEKAGTPAALGVITATGYGYRREDGIHVIPVGALGP